MRSIVMIGVSFQRRTQCHGDDIHHCISSCMGCCNLAVGRARGKTRQAVTAHSCAPAASEE